jgi:hypothetical protein
MALLSRTGPCRLTKGRADRRGLHRIGAAILMLLSGWTMAPAQAQDATLEYAVKANYLYKFGPFVEWPAEAFPAPNSPFNVCVAGDDPFGPVLDEAARGQSVQGHPVAVHRLAAVTASASCHVLYLGRSRTQTPAEALKAVRNQPVLTVSDERQGTSRGIVNFVLKDGRVRFALDAEAAQANGLALSSKLLALSVGAPR